jgi:hypothetical protein
MKAVAEREFLPYLLPVKRWNTPASKYPTQKMGSAEISRRIYRRNNYYCMEGVNGYAFYKTVNSIMVTELLIDNKVWMVDDPMHWWAMKTLARKSTGKVLCGGLGLGLIIHALLQNKQATKIDVVEVNSDVIQMVKPLLPESSMLNIEEADVFSKNAEDYDTVILDTWMWNTIDAAKEAFFEMYNAFAHFKVQNPQANVYIWGHPNNAINPTFNVKVRKLMLELMS